MTISPSHFSSFRDDPNQVISKNEQRPAPWASHSTAWMPLEGLAQQWASFAATFFTYPAFTATAAVFSALALETHALQQYEHACFRRLTGEESRARAAGEQAVHALHDACAQWMYVLDWLQRLVSTQPFESEEEDHAMLRQFFTEATAQLQRVGVLTHQVQTACVLSYQQQGLPCHSEHEGEDQ
jgi:hypothetical protein